MIILKILAQILIGALILTFITSQIKYYDYSRGVSTQPDALDLIQGFPFEVNRTLAPSVVLTLPETRDPYKIIIYSYLFWLCGISAWIFLSKQSQKIVNVNLVLAFVCGLTLMQIYLSSQRFCIKGYPIKFLSICKGVSYNNPVLFFAILDFAFWFVIGLIVVTLVRVTERLPKLFIFKASYFFTPLILTVLSFVNYISCSGFFCFMPSGRGFPMYYWIDLHPPVFNLKYFIIDFVFWFIAYMVIRIAWIWLRKLIH